MATISKSWSKNSNFQSPALDRSLLMCVCALMGVGLVLVYSASFIFAAENYGDGLYFFKRQLIFVVLGVAALSMASYIPFTILRRFFWVFYFICIALLLALYAPGLGHRVGGALRWLNLPFGFHLEPSELTKLMAPVIFSYLLVYDRQDEAWWIFWVKAVVLVAVPVFLMLKQPDFGSSAIFFFVGLALLFCFGLPWRYLIAGILVSIPTFYFLVMTVHYRRQRVMTFLNPWQDQANTGFQVIQSLLSVHAGGLTGVGLGKGQGKLFFLPEAHTDFILAVLGEETGFLGLAIVMLLFGWLVFRAIQISLRSSDAFGKRLAIGFACLIAFEAIINAGVVTGLLPTKGLAMPFLSYGGSSLISVSLACGVLINIYRRGQAFHG